MAIRLDPFQRIIAVQDPTITPDYSFRNEGQNVVFSCFMPCAFTGTLCWELAGTQGTINDSDFSSPSNAVSSGGTVEMSNGTGSFTVTIANDVTTEGTEKFVAKLKDCSTDEIYATSDEVTIYDTSIAETVDTISLSNLPTDSGIDVKWNNDSSSVAFTNWSDTGYEFGCSVYNVSGSSGSLIRRFYAIANTATYTCDWNSAGTKIMLSGNHNLTQYQYTDPYGILRTENAELEIWDRSGNSFTRSVAAGSGTDAPGGLDAGPLGARWIGVSSIAVPEGSGYNLYTVNPSSLTYNGTISGTTYLPTGTKLQYSSGYLYSGGSGTQMQTSVSTGAQVVVSIGPNGEYLNDFEVGGSYVSFATNTTDPTDTFVAAKSSWASSTWFSNISLPDDHAGSISVAWNSTRTKLAVGAPAYGTAEHILVYNRSGSTLTLDTSYTGFGNGAAPTRMAWSPNGTYIAAVYNVAPYFRIFKVA
jgi:hypothetical protein